jgi:NADP-dependent 3-hydroxy acid dehydrogenase YdfG
LSGTVEILLNNRKYSATLIVGMGAGISASLARLFSNHGLKAAPAARVAEKRQPLAHEVSRAP